MYWRIAIGQAESENPAHINGQIVGSTQLTLPPQQTAAVPRRRCCVALLAMPFTFPPPRILTSTLRNIPKSKSSNKYPCLIQNFLDFASKGQLKEAIDSLPLLARQGFRFNDATIAFLLRQCANMKSLEEGKRVHLHLKLTGLKHPSTFLSNHLIRMYARCGDHVKARQVFDKMPTRNMYSWNHMLSGYAMLGMLKPALRLFYKMPERDIVSWNTMVMAHVQTGCYDEALRLYKDLRTSGVGVNEYSFAGVVTISVELKDLCLAAQLHCQVFIVGYFSNMILSSSIVDAYAKCGKLVAARKLFDEMVKRDVLAWTTLISGYAQSGDMKSAQEIFDTMPEKNDVSWTALISGYARNGTGQQALKLLSEVMGLAPDQFAFIACLFACASLTLLQHGKQIHARLITSGVRPSVVVLSALIHMYSKCGSLEVGKRVFNMVESKNLMITALAQHGDAEQAIKMFSDMVKLGVRPDSVIFPVLNQCTESFQASPRRIKVFTSP